MQKKWKKRALLALMILILIAIPAFDVRLSVKTYEIQSAKIKAPLTLALVTDLHSCRYGKGQKTLIDAVNALNPDAVLLGGDIFDDKQPDVHTELFIKGIAKDTPIYYVTGNHEFWREETQSVFDFMTKHGVTVLRGESALLTLKGQSIGIHGIDDPDGDLYGTAVDLAKRQLFAIDESGKKDDANFNLLMAHRPAYIHTYLNFNYDLVVSGHAHGGQWRIPLLLNGLLAPDEGFFPKYAGGHYVFEKGQLIVSRGLARESTRVPRIFNRPELVKITLNP